MVIIALVLLGLCFGSFVNALVWRTRQQSINNKQKTISSKQLSILSGRSQCVNCGHQIAAIDLIPVISWLFLRGRCRYCQKPISWQYPIVEITLGLIFAVSYYFWFNPVELISHSTGAGPIGAGQWLLFVTWLSTSVGLLALAVYDIRWMLLPNKILYPTFLVAITGRLAYILFFSHDIAHSFWLLALSLLVAGGIFWLIYIFSRGKAIGFGDVRLGAVTGTVLAGPLLSLQMIFIASVLGTVAILPGLLSRHKTLTTKVPYGPFLIMAAFIVLLFGASFSGWYQNLILP
ncbi:MAG: prepilin peptidase [bacterium]|nr:prepilin peptidase [bacterium]